MKNNQGTFWQSGSTGHIAQRLGIIQEMIAKLLRIQLRVQTGGSLSKLERLILNVL